ncbi:MAG: 1,2-phenylacetyl-CoA epoxidase subunit PaaC [Candidatus Dormibacteria bacterium]
MTSGTAVATSSDIFDYALRLGDDALVLSHRLSEWAAHAPEFEEDVALANLALDLLGQARSLLTYAGQVEGKGRGEDGLAYWRDDRQFRNLLLVEQPNGDFAMTIVRHLLFAAYQLAMYEALEDSADSTFAGVAAKGAKEARYHRDHAALWTVRLGDGTEESHQRMDRALLALWPLTAEMFQMDAITLRLAEDGVIPAGESLRPSWDHFVDATLKEATLDVPRGLAQRTGGRAGLHSEYLGHLLAEMQHLHRSHLDASW